VLVVGGLCLRIADGVNLPFAGRMTHFLRVTRKCNYPDLHCEIETLAYGNLR
jgi:hypothetical protein